MIWWDRNKVLTQWTEVEATFQQALLSVYKCQQKLPVVPVIHLHIPKTAGSSLKKWATLTGYKLHDHYDQTVDGDGAYWMGAPARLGNCKQRLWERHLNNGSWFPVERWLDLPLCEEFQYVVTLREPVPRLLHQFHHFMSCFSKPQRLQVLQGQPNIEKFIPVRLMSLWNYEELKLQIPKQLRGNLTSQEAADAIRWPSDWLELWLGMTSNYQVRSLAGAGDGKAYLEDAPKAARRLLGAKAVLEQLDVVLTAGAHGHDAADEMLLKEGLRTPKPSESGFPFVSHTIFDDQKISPFRFNPLKLSWPVALDLQQRNHADRLLLSYARRLRRLDRIYFRMVAQEQCQDVHGKSRKTVRGDIVIPGWKFPSWPPNHGRSSEPSKPWQPRVGMAGRQLSYEEILSEHSFPASHPLGRGRIRQNYSGSLAVRRATLPVLSRRYASTTAFLLSNVTCFQLNTSAKEALSCCESRPASSTCPFLAGKSQSMCCEKERLRRELRQNPEGYPWNVTAIALPAWKLPEGRPPDCKLIPQLPSMTLQMWLGRLLQHGAQAARCVHGLADKLQETPDAAESVAFLAAELARKCPGRRTLLALRRNLMIWWDRNKVLTHWTEMEATFQQALLSVYKCQQKLPVVPVIHLHIPKTAGSSLKKWATLTGYRVLDQNQQTWQGDGPYWIGAAARPGSCKQRLWERHLNNGSWFPVERWLDLPLCEEFHYVVTLREPVPRLLHQFHHFFSYFRDSLSTQRLQPEPLETLAPRRFVALWRYEELRHQLRGRRRARKRLKLPPRLGSLDGKKGGIPPGKLT
eukprot:s2893_g12.t1